MKGTDLPLVNMCAVYIVSNWIVLEIIKQSFCVHMDALL